MRSLVAVFGLGIIVLIFAVSCGGESETPTASAPTSPPLPTANPDSTVPPAGVPVFEVTLADGGGSGPFIFEPADLTFNEGQEVNFSYASEAAPHTFTVRDLGIDVVVNAGETADFTFTFETSGTFELVCRFHEGIGMVGTITVQ